MKTNTYHSLIIKLIKMKQTILILSICLLGHISYGQVNAEVEGKTVTTELQVTSNPTTGHILTSDATGNATWQAPAGGSSYSNEIKDTDNDTKIQVEESVDEDIIRFDLSGTEVLTLSKNVGGRLIMEPKNTFFNVFLGDDAGRNVTSGAYSNTFIGALAGRVATSGLENTIVGTQAGASITTQGGNTMIGRWAGRDNTGQQNTFIGLQAGREDTLTSFTTMVGAYAGSNSSGEVNTFLGYGAGQNCVGNRNVMIGRYAGQDNVGSHRLYIDNTDTPDPLIYGEFDNNLLRINGNLEAKDELYVGQSSTISNTWAIAHFQNPDSNAGSGIYLQASDSGFTNTDGVQISVSDGANPYVSYNNREAGGHRFFTKGSVGVKRMEITNDGDVVIGNTAPATGYRLSVDGKIACEEVLVDLNADWPDYVFTPEYDLKTLAEVEAHISEKGHLPGVPSAQEVADNGIQLAEMNRVLMEKIEELTLYILEIDEELKSEKNKRVELGKRLEILEKK